MPRGQHQEVTPMQPRAMRRAWRTDMKRRRTTRPKETETMTEQNDTVPVRVTIECQGRRTDHAHEVWRVWPYGEPPADYPRTASVVLDATVDSITVEELTPPREWRPGDVVQGLNPGASTPWTLVRNAKNWRSASGVTAYYDDEVTELVTTGAWRGLSQVEARVLREQATEQPLAAWERPLAEGVAS